MQLVYKFNYYLKPQWKFHSLWKFTKKTMPKTQKNASLSHEKIILLLQS